MWRDNLLPASFKGISFFVEDHTLEAGRRLNPNEFPYSDKTYTEDLGRSARRYNITGYLIGDDYMDPRDDLLDAAEAGGVGTLVHPYYGEIDVLLNTIRMRESKNEGGYVVIEFTFVEYGQQVYPDPSPVGQDLVDLAADDLLAAAKAYFVETMSIVGQPGWVVDNFSGSLQNTAEILENIKNNGGINNQTTTDLVNKAAEWVADLADLESPSITLLQNVSDSADRIINAIKGLIDLSPSAENTVLNLQAFDDYSTTTTGGLSAQSVISDNNAVVTQDFVKTVAVSTEARAIIASDFTSYEDAVASRKQILAKIDDLSGTTQSDSVYEAYRNLRTSIATALPGDENSLPRLSSLKLAQSTPSLVLAYDLYGSTDKEQEILDRNKIRHPGFVPGGQDLSVLQYETDRT